jgi:lysophospholipase L1-like esterase
LQANAPKRKTVRVFFSFAALGTLNALPRLCGTLIVFAVERFSMSFVNKVGSVFFAALAVALAPFAHAQTRNYIALGDSYAFGYTSDATTPEGLGDIGYVAPVADFLATRLGGVRPTVTNLAVPGETSTSFFTGAPSAFTVPPVSPAFIDAPFRDQNRNDNYPNIARPQVDITGVTPGNAQFDALQAQVNSIRGAGNSIDYITVQFGGNDVLALFAQSSFTSLDSFSQGIVLNNRFNNLQTRYQQLLTYLTGPSVGIGRERILLVGYADPFRGLGASNPLILPGSGGTVNNPFSTQLTLQANSLISGLAQANGVQYVDIYTPFLGNEVAYTNITTIDNDIPNFHPNATGYSVIASQIANVVSAPEPAALPLALFALSGFTLIAWRKRTA